MQAVLMQRGKLWVETLDDPRPGPGEVLVKSRACGICGSDLHAARHTEEFVATSREAGGAFNANGHGISGVRGGRHSASAGRGPARALPEAGPPG